MNFVQTLKDKDNVDFLFSSEGVASRLAGFFERPEEVDAGTLMRFYKELVKEPIRMTPEDYSVQIEGARLVGKRFKRNGTDRKREQCDGQQLQFYGFLALLGEHHDRCF